MSSKSKLIAVRFSEEELERLQEAAEDEGVGPSTLVRIIVNLALKPEKARPRKMTSDEFQSVMSKTMARLDQGKVDGLLKDISIGNPDDPALLVWAGETRKWQEFTSHFLNAFLGSLGIEVNIPENNKDNHKSAQPRAALERPSENFKVTKPYLLSRKDGETKGV